MKGDAQRALYWLIPLRLPSSDPSASFLLALLLPNRRLPRRPQTDTGTVLGAFADGNQGLGPAEAPPGWGPRPGGGGGVPARVSGFLCPLHGCTEGSFLSPSLTELPACLPGRSHHSPDLPLGGNDEPPSSGRRRF